MSAWDDFINTIKQGAGDVQNAIGDIGNIAGQQKILPGGYGPTISQVVSPVNKFLQSMQPNYQLNPNEKLVLDIYKAKQQRDPNYKPNEQEQQVIYKSGEGFAQKLPLVGGADVVEAPGIAEAAGAENLGAIPGRENLPDLSPSTTKGTSPNDYYLRNPDTGNLVGIKSDQATAPPAEYATETPTSPMYQGAEGLPAPQNQYTTQGVPPIQEKIPSGKDFWAQEPDLTTLEKIQLKGTGVNKFPVDSPTTEDFYKKVYIRDLQGTTPEAKFQDLDNASTRLIDDAKNAVKDAPAMNYQQEFNSYIDNAVDKMVGEGQISPMMADTVKTAAKTKMFTIVGGAPDEITPSELLDAHPKAAQFVKNAYKNGQLNLGDPNANIDIKASVAADRGIEDALYSKYPQVGLDMSKYGAINGDGGLRDILSGNLRNQPSAYSIGIPKTGLKLPLGRIAAEAAGGNKLGLLGLGAGLGAAGAAGLPPLISYLNKGDENKASSQTSIPSVDMHSTNIPPTSIPTDKSQVDPIKSVIDPNTLTDQSNQPLVIKDEDYNAKVKEYNDLLKDPKWQVFPNSKILQGMRDSLETQHSTSQKLVSGYSLATNIDSNIETAKQLLANAPVNLLTTYGTFEALNKAENGKYRALAAALQNIEKSYPKAAGTLLIPQNRDTALAALNQAKVNNDWDYYSTVLSPYVNKTTSQSGTPTQSQPLQTTPSMPSSTLPTPTSTGLNQITPTGKSMFGGLPANLPAAPTFPNQ